MNTISVPLVTGFDQMDKFAAGVIGFADWEETFPYKPDVSFRIAHDGEKILIRFDVTECNIRAVTTTQDGPVWEDSCVEFFVKEPDSRYYFNFETNCIGVGLNAKRLSRTDFMRLNAAQAASVVRRSSLPCQLTDISEGGSWSLELEVPFSVICENGRKPDTLMANFYKCGDKTAVPHFLSWNKIDVPSPDFHVPEFFGRLELE